MSWSEALAVGSGLVSFIVLLGSALGRETIGELKRRTASLEEEMRKLLVTQAAHAAVMAKLEERTNGMTESLKRIEEQMVPRAEWEARHTATESMLQRILSRLEGRESVPSPEAAPWGATRR